MSDAPAPPSSSDAPLAALQVEDETAEPAAEPQRPRRPLRPGQLVPAWRAVIVIGWAAIAVAMMVTAGAAEIMHRSVWWIGDGGDAAPVLFALIPFALPILVIVMALLDQPYIAELSVVASISTFFVALADRSDSPSAAVVTAALGVAGLLMSIAAFSGRVRKARPVAAEPPVAPTTA